MQKTNMLILAILLTLTLALTLTFAFTLTGCTTTTPDPPGGNGETEVPVDSPGSPDEEMPPDNHGEIPGNGEGGGGEIPEELDIEQTIELYSFLASPIKGAQVSSVNGQLPNAPRRYRNGVHEGLDYYDTRRGTPVLAAAEGVVIRADHDYVEVTLEEYDEVIRISMEEEITPEELLDKLRGRQIWIEHQYGIITRYAHLDSISADITVGVVLEKGQHIGTVGDSGTKSGVVGKTLSASGAPHLHFEVWRGGRFLGQGLTPDEVRHIYTEIFKE